MTAVTGIQLRLPLKMVPFRNSYSDAAYTEYSNRDLDLLSEKGSGNSLRTIAKFALVPTSV